MSGLRWWTWRKAPSPFFFLNDTATTEIYTLSLHDALPISGRPHGTSSHPESRRPLCNPRPARLRDRKSTRLNSSHSSISYGVFCFKKKDRLRERLLALGPVRGSDGEPAAEEERRQRADDASFSGPQRHPRRRRRFPPRRPSD